MRYVNRDLFEIQDTVVIAHGCNAQMKMNSGVAKGIREKFPLAYTRYMQQISSTLPGECQLIQIPDSSVYVANLITQKYYGYDGKKYVVYGAVYESFSRLINRMEVERISYYPIHIPKIGAGLGGGEWSRIVEAIEEACYVRGFDSDQIVVHEQ